MIMFQLRERTELKTMDAHRQSMQALHMLLPLVGGVVSVLEFVI